MLVTWFGVTSLDWFEVTSLDWFGVTSLDWNITPFSLIKCIVNVCVCLFYLYIYIYIYYSTKSLSLVGCSLFRSGLRLGGGGVVAASGDSCCGYGLYSESDSDSESFSSLWKAFKPTRLNREEFLVTWWVSFLHCYHSTLLFCDCVLFYGCMMETVCFVSSAWSGLGHLGRGLRALFFVCFCLHTISLSPFLLSRPQLYGHVSVLVLGS